MKFQLSTCFSKNISNDEFCSGEAEFKWIEHFFRNDVYPFLNKLVDIVLPFLVSNVSVEKVFSFLVYAQWTNERTVEYLLQVNVNLDHSFNRMHGITSTNKQLLARIVSGN